MGGEITWSCQGNGRYIFTMKLYRDCNGTPLNTNLGLRVHNHPTLNAIPMQLISQTDISPQCNGSPSISCEQAQTSGSDVAGAVEEFVFRSNLITLTGVPPPQGWIFTFTDCCRNSAITNLIINPVETGFTLRAIMYPYQGMEADPCFDSSPEFTQLPAVILCAGTPFTYNHNAYDADQDSLVYSFGRPLDFLQSNAPFNDFSPPQIMFEGGFTSTNPFNENTTNSLNTQTGEMAFTPSLGNYVSVVRVQSFRCGQLISEIFREIQVVVISCGANNPPIVTAPFPDVNGIYTSFSDTVQAGELVSFTMTVTDDEFLPSGFPQTISIEATGGQFGANFNDPNSGCLSPPCATLSPEPPLDVQSNETITFFWQTSCEHVSIEEDCFRQDNIHTFVLSFKDDFCPAPFYRVVTISVVVQAPPIVESPELRCIDVLENEDIELSWIPSQNVDNQFFCYNIYASSNPNGPYALLDSVFDINQSNWTHINPGNTGPMYYYIRTRSSCDGAITSLPLDTLASMYITATDAGSGLINVNWNPLSNPLLATAQLPYSLFKSIESVPFTLLANPQQNTYQDFMSGCGVQIDYTVSITDASGCVSRSNRNGGFFINDEAPDAPVMDSISVVTFDQSITLSWQESTSADTRGYIVYQLINGEIVSADTVIGINNISYETTAPDPSLGSVTYAIAAIDECDNVSELSNPSSTIWLQFDLSTCENRVILSWTPYEGWSNPVTSYTIYQRVNDGGFVEVGQTSGSEGSFTLTGLTPSDYYCFLIQASSIDVNSTSTSNLICFEADVQELPEFTYIRYVTVENDERLKLACLIDTSADITFYQIKRGIFPSEPTEIIFTGAIPPASNEVVFTDEAVNVGAVSYVYEVSVLDKCDNASGVSNKGRSILLRGLAGDGFINRLTWNSYGEWDAGVEEYQLFRSIDNGLSFTELSEGLNDTTFQDQVLDELDEQIRFCYYVRAIESEGNVYGYRDTSVSNIVCVIQQPTIYFPNAFRPSALGVNKTFRPLGLYEKLATNYIFRIFNRWGEELFSTSDPEQAWDGKYLDTFVQTGIYVYTVRFNLPEGQSYRKNGSVMVLD